MGIIDSTRTGASSPLELVNKVHEIRKILKSLSLQQALEVLANVFIFEGMAFMGHDPTEVSPLTVYALVAEDIKNHGSNLANSTAKLGVELLISLNRIE